MNDEQKEFFDIRNITLKDTFIKKKCWIKLSFNLFSEVEPIVVVEAIKFVNLNVQEIFLTEREIYYQTYRSNKQTPLQ